MLLTRGSYRWQNRSPVWRESWRNLRHPDPVGITLEVAREGDHPATIGADWQIDAALDEGSWWVQPRAAKRQAGLDTLGWADHLETFRPFLAYDELGPLFAEPSKLHDALAPILGLDRLADAQTRLAATQKAIGESAAVATRSARDLRLLLAASNDERAAAALTEIARPRPDLGVVRALATGTTPDNGGDLARLQALARLDAPSRAAFIDARNGFLRATAELDEVAREGATAVDRQRDLLAAALAVHDQDGDGPCPVCGEGQLDAAWEARVRSELEDDRHRRDRLSAARSRLVTARQQLLISISPAPSVLATAANHAGGAEALDAWRRWSSLAADAESAATEGAAALDAVEAAVGRIRQYARGELGQREDSWQPLAVRLSEWHRHAELAEKDRDRLATVNAASSWVKENTLQLSNERLQPVAVKARRIWTLLRQDSDVDLGAISLAGSATRRRVNLAACVDGEDAGALGVLSQGEAHALALALFLPRATSPGSPFGFLVIDDPVQAMDPAKVDGLARVLEEVAADRQVVVFTHDDRLPEAVRRLEIEARILEVTRTGGSTVTVTTVSDPAARYLDDARAVASDRALTDDITHRVVPELCRLALEAACRDRYFGRRLLAGDQRPVVEKAWTSATTTRARVELVIPGDSAAADRWLKASPARKSGLTVCTKAVHQGLNGDPHRAIDDVQTLLADLPAHGR